MKDFEKALEHITESVKAYRKAGINDGDKLVRILQQITATLYYLENERAKVHDKFQVRINELILEGNSVSRSENMAHAEIPEMYLFRRIMDSGYKVVDAIRTQVSWIKSEKQSTNG